MTENGQAMLNEYIAEIKEQFEDDTTALRLSTARWILSHVLSLLSRVLQFSVIIFTFIIGMALFLGGVEFINFLQQGAADEILASLNSTVAISILLGMFTAAMFYVLRPRYLMETPFYSREVIDSKNIDFMRRAITIHEGVLIRHGLINTEAVNNG